MSVRLTFKAISNVASEIFGLELVRSGTRFKLLEEGIAVGEGHGDLWSLKDMRELFQEWLNHPQAMSFRREELREALTA